MLASPHILSTHMADRSVNEKARPPTTDVHSASGVAPLAAHKYDAKNPRSRQHQSSVPALIESSVISAGPQLYSAAGAAGSVAGLSNLSRTSSQLNFGVLLWMASTTCEWFHGTGRVRLARKDC
jgi:hypothetical protein